VLNSKRARDLKFPAFALSMKFVAWPLVMAAFLAVFGNAFHPMDQKILRLMSFMPLPANSVALAVMFKNSPDKVAEAVWISTLIALVLIPVLFS
ncbi:MAG: hypothetical protein HYX67_14415, partial [Candidatus Melainabacteria bacterium]|nr:hypothetical protein [Candidatus Melainabacteria bacterium]